MNSLPKYWLGIAITIHLLAAWFSIGHYHDDEYAQILSFATSKIGMDMQSELMWEFEAGVRSGFQPNIAFVIAKVTSFVGIDSPFILAFIYRLISAVISFAATVVFINAIAKDISSKTAFKWAVFFLFFSWVLLFINVRFSSEGWATSFFLLGLGLYLYPNPASIKRYLSIGFFLGLAFLARYQVGFMLLGLGLWMLFIHRISYINLFYILLAGVLTLILGAGFDWWLYGEPTVSSWQYFKWHYDGLTSASGGISTSVYEPWWFYIQYSALQLIPPITLLLPIVVVVFWVLFPTNAITWLTIPFVFFHTYFGHKEMRYLFPLLPFAPVMFAMVCINLNQRFKLMEYRFVKYSWQLILGVSLFLNVILVVLVLSIPASKEVALWQSCLTPIAVEKPTILLILDQNGSYSDPAELNLDFYNTKSLTITSVRNESHIKEIMAQHPEKNILYASRKRNRSQQLDEANLSHQLTCQALPNWILKININNWTSRTSMWRIWSIKK
jgi:GPI mannosyltransferase 3